MEFQIKATLLYYFTANGLIKRQKILKIIAYYWENSGEIGMFTPLVT